MLPQMRTQLMRMMGKWVRKEGGPRPSKDCAQSRALDKEGEERKTEPEVEMSSVHTQTSCSSESE